VFLLLALLLLLLLPEPWNLLGALASGAAGCVEVVYWQRRVRRRRAAVGVGTLVGATAEVASPCRPRGQIRLKGELWEARCAAGADPGTVVRVLAVDGLTLEVEPR
jgi:membrane-bound serine protease (ClpP class)